VIGAWLETSTVVTAALELVVVVLAAAGVAAKESATAMAALEALSEKLFMVVYSSGWACRSRKGCDRTAAGRAAPVEWRYEIR